MTHEAGGQEISPEQPIAWRAVRPETPIRSADSQTAGRLADLLASDQEDIFHGIVVRLDEGGRDVFIPADDVTLMTPSYLEVSYTLEQLDALPDHTEERQAEVGWLGRFRR
jgi:hypothetical protein